MQCKIYLLFMFTCITYSDVFNIECIAFRSLGYSTHETYDRLDAVARR